MLFYIYIYTSIWQCIVYIHILEATGHIQNGFSHVMIISHHLIVVRCFWCPGSRVHGAVGTYSAQGSWRGTSSTPCVRLLPGWRNEKGMRKIRLDDANGVGFNDDRLINDYDWIYLIYCMILVSYPFISNHNHNHDSTITWYSLYYAWSIMI